MQTGTTLLRTCLYSPFFSGIKFNVFCSTQLFFLPGDELTQFKKPVEWAEYLFPLHYIIISIYMVVMNNFECGVFKLAQFGWLVKLTYALIHLHILLGYGVLLEICLFKRLKM